MIEVQADYALRGRDYETELVGPITDTIIDADRLARIEHCNGFPNFALYRLIYAGDRRYFGQVRQWWVMFSVEWCRGHTGLDLDTAVNAAWDSLIRVVEPRRELHPSMTEVADALGCDKKSFIRASRNLQMILRTALAVYWDWLVASYCVIRAKERRT